MLQKVLFLIFVLNLGCLGWAVEPSAAEVKPKYGPEATPLSLSHGFFRTHDAPSFWALIPYYIPQQTGSSCSVATVAMIVNAARVGTPFTSENKLATESDLLEKVNQGAWKKEKWALHRGASLEELKPLLEASLKNYGVSPLSIEMVHTSDESESTQKQLHEHLLEIGKTSHEFILANFVQGVYTGDADVGHYAPLGAYDAEKKRVLVLDPDREWYEPYWVSEKTLLKGMATRDPGTGQNRGYITVKVRAR